MGDSMHCFAQYALGKNQNIPISHRNFSEYVGLQHQFWLCFHVKELNDNWEVEDENKLEEMPLMPGADINVNGTDAGKAFREEVKTHCLQVQRETETSYLNYRLNKE